MKFTKKTFGEINRRQFFLWSDGNQYRLIHKMMANIRAYGTENNSYCITNGSLYDIEETEEVYLCDLDEHKVIMDAFEKEILGN